MNIQHKLFASLLLLALGLIAAFYALVQWGMDRGVLEYLNSRELARQQVLVEALAEIHQRDGDWRALRRDPRQWRELIGGDQAQDFRRPPPGAPPRLDPPPRRGGEFQRPPPRRGAPPGAPPPLPGGRPAISLLDANQQAILGRYAPNKQSLLAPITVAGSTVGWLAMGGHERLTDDFDIQFLQAQKTLLLGISLLIAAVAACLAFPLARHFVGPIRQLTRAADQLARGDYAVELPAARSDELGQLARDVNELARTLDANQQARQRWVADISHELRTPVAILLGEIEAIIDGVRRADAAQLDSLRQEALHLRKLIGDLHDLSAADIGALNYRKQVVDLAELLPAVVARHRPVFAQAGIELQLAAALNSAPVWADEGRLNQLFDNLLANSCKYTATGGQARLSLRAEGGSLLVELEDSSPGVGDAALPKLFDYLYREEASRNRRSGGSGLGLSICQRIAAAHDGELAAYHSPLGGLGVRLRLPRDKQERA